MRHELFFQKSSIEKNVYVLQLFNSFSDEISSNFLNDGFKMCFIWTTPHTLSSSHISGLYKVILGNLHYKLCTHWPHLVYNKPVQTTKKPVRIKYSFVNDKLNSKHLLVKTNKRNTYKYSRRQKGHNIQKTSLTAINLGNIRVI